MGDEGDVGLRAEQRGPARWLTIDRPQRRNALTRAIVAALVAEIGSIDLAETRAIVITGSAPVFCAGGDLGDLGGAAERGSIAVTDDIYTGFHRLVTAIGTSPVPVIAAIGGAALGAGLDLAMCCDLRYATPAASFVSSWIKVGLVPGMGGAHLLTRAIGPTRAAELVLLARAVTADEALEWGLVNGVVPAEDLDGQVESVVRELAALSPAAVRRSKAALRRARDAGMAEELATLGAVQGTLLTGPDFRAATERFR